MITTSKKAAASLAASLLALGFVTACGKTSTESSAVKVTNGIKIKESQYAATVLLVMEMKEGEALCTGTFVNDSQVVTAGHCVEGLDAKKPEIYYATQVNGQFQAKAQAVTFLRNPKYVFADGVGPSDVSVITFPAHTAPATVALATETPAVGTEFTIVGYGNNTNFVDKTSGVLSGDGAGVKREGTNYVGSTDGGMIAFGGLTGVEKVDPSEVGTYVASGEGDSGGPLLVNGKLAGVTSGGGLGKADDNKTDVAISFYVDLNSPESKAFLKTALKSSTGSNANVATAAR